MRSVSTTSQKDARTQNRKGEKRPVLCSPRPLEEGISRIKAPYSKEDMGYILRRHGELAAEGKRDYKIARVLAGEMGRGVSSLSGTIRKLRKEGALGPDARHKEKKLFSASELEVIVRTRAEMDEQGKTDTEISQFLADKLGRTQTSTWDKLQQMIRDGELEKKRALMRARRRRSFSAASRREEPKGGPSRLEKSPAHPLRPPAPQNKGPHTFGDGPQRPEPRAATGASPNIVALLEKARKINASHESRFVLLGSSSIPQECLGNVMEFVQSAIENEGRLSRRMTGTDAEHSFALAGGLKIDVESRGSQIFFRKDNLPALIFIATMEMGTDEEISAAIRALRSELEANNSFSSQSAPHWLELKLWAAREFHLENDLSGRHASASMKVRNAIDFKGFRKFFDATLDKHI